MFNNVMHIAFFTDNMDEMIDFYINKLGCKIKTLTRYSSYKDRPDRGKYYERAQTNPNGIFNTYIELAPNQFLELFPKEDEQKPHQEQFSDSLGYGHFALTVDDIFEARKILESRGVKFLTEISKGPSETYQMWTRDPDDNWFEIMQFTEKSYQVVGHIDPEI
jgi:Lactoylglutathione lyase and related lyases